MGQFDQRVAMITGSGSGIGRATAKIFASRGADIVVQDINPDGAQETAEAIRALGREALVCTYDVADVAAVRQAVQRAE